MNTWIRGRDIQTVYHIGKSKAYDLLREFQYQSDPKDYIKDGRLLIVKQEAFEDWWRHRRKEA